MFETYSPQTLRAAIETELQNNPNLNAKAAAMIAMKRLGDNPLWYEMNKARDTSKLTKKVITDKKGVRRTVYVKLHDDEKKNDSWLNGIMSFFGFSDKKQVFKKLDEDYKSHDMGRKFNLTWDGWKSHVSAYFDNKEKWDKFFSGKHEGKGSGDKKESKEKKEKKADKKKSPLRLSVMKEIFSMYGGAKPEVAAVPVQTIEPVAPAVQENTIIGITGKDLTKPWEMTRDEWTKEKNALKFDTGEYGSSKLGISKSKTGAEKNAETRKEITNALNYGMSKESDLRPLSGDMARIGNKVDHADVVYKAIKNGEKVPEDVLKEYKNEPEFKDLLNTPQENNFETMPEKDPSRVQEIKNSIAEGELIIKTGMINGRKLSIDEIQAVQKSVDNAKKRIGLNTPPVLPPHLQSIADKQKGFSIEDVTPKGFGPDEPETESKSDTPEQKAKDKKVSKKIKQATPENRNETEREIAGIPEPTEEKLSELESQVNSKPFEPIGNQLEVPFYQGGNPQSFAVLDYSSVEPKSIFLSREKDILDKPRPPYIPEMNERYFKSLKYTIPVHKLSENKYVIQTQNVGDNKYVIVSRDVWAATQDYYLKKAKATNKKFYDEYNAKNKTNVKPKRLTMLSQNRMTYEQSGLMRFFTGQPGYDWITYRALTKELKQKQSDMEIQIEEYYNTHAKGHETSYGDSGTKDNLLPDYGVKVKRQNGAEINEVEIQEVKMALDDVYSVFGNRSSMAKNFGLKISHSGDVLMHARKAAGLFSPAMNAIGITAQSGQKAMGFILAHEFGHFMDFYLGGKENRHYASDNPESLAGSIAETFRTNMRQLQKSDYQNRTCECFARSMEQYWAIKTGETQLLQDWDEIGNHPSKETFMEKIYPLCERFFTENSGLLKAMKIPFYIKRKDGNGKTIYVKGQTK